MFVFLLHQSLHLQKFLIKFLQISTFPLCARPISAIKKVGSSVYFEINLFQKKIYLMGWFFWFSFKISLLFLLSIVDNSNPKSIALAVITCKSEYA